MRDLTPVSGDLHAYYPMNTGSGKILRDQTFNELDGKLQGDIKWVDVSDVSVSKLSETYSFLTSVLSFLLELSCYTYAVTF